jgi:alkylation response protein AidB-like acyl-CoA dehydrogenase
MVAASLAGPLEALVLSTTEEGRRIGRMLDAAPERVEVMAGFRLSAALNTLGCPAWLRPVPFTLLDGQAMTGPGVVERCRLYETLGYVDPNLLFAAPGPSMSAFVVNRIGDDVQQRRFFQRFAAALTWSFFALTEPGTGSDAGRIATTATRVAGGYRLSGQKYLIGNGAIATIGIVFARTAPGPLGINAFLVEPRRLAGVHAERLPMTGCRGANLAHLVFDNVLLPGDALLGAHLKPTERISSSAAATFDALRPCVAAVAVGIARAVLDQAESAGLLTRATDRDAAAQARLELDALGQGLRRVCLVRRRAPRIADRRAPEGGRNESCGSDRGRRDREKRAGRLGRPPVVGKGMARHQGL